MSGRRATAADVPAWGRRAARSILWGYTGVGVVAFLFGLGLGISHLAVFGAGFVAAAVGLTTLIRWALIVDSEIPYSG